jgi:hypothetical protein
MFHYYMNASASWWMEVCVPRVLAALGHDVGRAELAGQHCKASDGLEKSGR